MMGGESPPIFLYMAKNYDNGGILQGNDPLNWNPSSFFSALNPFGMIDDIFGSVLFGDRESSSNLAKELTGYSSQQREFEQQEYLMDKENEYNTPAAQMARMKAAGINPQLAAAGIAGSQNVSASPSQVPSNTAGAAQGLNAAMNAVGTVADSANKWTAAEKMQHEIHKIDVDTEKSLVDMGFTTLQSRALGVQLKYMDYKERMSCYQALANFETTKAQYQNILAEHNKIIEECNTLIAQRGLMASEQEVNDAIVRKTNEEMRWQKLQNDFFAANGYIVGSPMFEGLRDAIVSGKSIDIDGLGDLIAGYEGKVQLVKSSAEAKASWGFIPTTPTQAIEYSANNIIKGKTWWSSYFSEGVKSATEALARVRSDKSAYKEFQDEYRDAKSDLYDVYKNARRKYREYRFSGASDQYIAELKRQMDDAYNAYIEFTEEKFSDELVKRLSPKE